MNRLLLALTSTPDPGCMEFKRFWQAYKRQSVLELFEQAMEAFQEPMSPEMCEAYNLIEVILEITGHHYKAKEFDKVVQFTDLIRHQQPWQYAQARGYIYMDLIDVFCFHGQDHRVRQVLGDMAETPEAQYDEFLLCIQKALYFGYVEEVDTVCQRIYPVIKRSSRLITGSEEDLAIYHIYHTLQRAYQRQHEKGQPIAWEALAADLEPYEFNQEASFIEPVSEGLFPSNDQRLIEQLPSRFRQDPAAALLVLQMCFLRYMLAQGTPFAVSIEIWGYLVAYWQKNAEESAPLGRFFGLEESSLQAYLTRQLGLVLDQRFKVALILWGGLYLYDFLYEQDLIDRITYRRSQVAIEAQIGRFMQSNAGSFWAYDFVHRWGGRPQSISPDRWEGQKEIFCADYEQLR